LRIFLQVSLKNIGINYWHNSVQLCSHYLQRFCHNTNLKERIHKRLKESNYKKALLSQDVFL
jgi:hypothetical protein